MRVCVPSCVCIYVERERERERERGTGGGNVCVSSCVCRKSERERERERERGTGGGNVSVSTRLHVFLSIYLVPRTQGPSLVEAIDLLKPPVRPRDLALRLSGLFY